jgi:hypothetical protein
MIETTLSVRGGHSAVWISSKSQRWGASWDIFDVLKDTGRSVVISILKRVFSDSGVDYSTLRVLGSNYQKGYICSTNTL